MEVFGNSAKGNDLNAELQDLLTKAIHVRRPLTDLC